MFFRMSVVKPWDVFRIVDQEDNHASNGKGLMLCKKFTKVEKINFMTDFFPSLWEKESSSTLSCIKL